MYKYRLKFAKTGKLKYLGHLDLFKTFQRAVKRARLPVKYSEGFNPHQKNSFALPLGLGKESICEYADIELKEALTEVALIQGLNNVLPEGFEILSAESIPINEKTAARICNATYEAKVSKKAAQILDSISYEDISPCVYEISIEQTENDNILNMTLAAGSTQSIKPEKVIEFIYKMTGEDPSDVTYKRTALGIEDRI